VIWILGGAGLALAMRAAFTERSERWRWAAAAALALPVAAFAFYRNAFPYFFAFALPGAAVLAGLATDRFAKRELFRWALVLVLVLGAAVHHQIYVRRGQQAQRAVVAAVHAMFPRPVPYLERAGMIASFPNIAFFMSSWGMDDYAAEGRPVLSERAARQPPVFMIVSHPAQVAALSGAPDPASGLLPQDAAFLRDDFIPHWGPVWVAGKRLPPSPQASTCEVATPGPYTVEAAAPLVIDGAPKAPGAVVRLARGPHAVAAHATPAALRWGDHLPKPASPPPDGPLYWWF
jgi:hypothetical protein